MNVHTDIHQRAEAKKFNNEIKVKTELRETGINNRYKSEIEMYNRFVLWLLLLPQHTYTDIYYICTCLSACRCFNA